MGKPMSVDLRQRVVAAVDGGMSRRKAAERFGVSISSAIRWTSRARRLGSVRPEPQGGDTRSARIEAFAHVILEAVEQKPDITLVELRELLAGRGAVFAVSTIWRFFVRQDHAQKKSAHAAEQDRPDVLARRRAWFRGQPDLDPQRLIFIDETGASTKMARFHGRTLRGQRLRAAIPHGHVWTPPTVQEESLDRMPRSRVLPCVRPLVRPKRRGPVWENEDQIHITGPRSKCSP